MGWVAGCVTAALVAAGLGAAIVFGGVFDVRASTQHIAVVGWAAHRTMEASVEARAEDIRKPAGFSRSQVLEGAKIYGEACVACHGGPGVARAPFASAMIPTPPYLVDAPRHWSRAELYEIVAHGVKMTAMPAWGELEPESRIWSVVAFLEAQPRLTPAEFAVLTSRPAGAPRPPAASP